MPSFCTSVNLFFRTASSDKSSVQRLIPISILLCALCRSFLELCFLDRSSLKSLLPSSTLLSAILIPFSICDRELLKLSTSLTFFCLVSSSFFLILCSSFLLLSFLLLLFLTAGASLLNRLCIVVLTL